jgi:hypothetical protein
MSAKTNLFSAERLTGVAQHNHEQYDGAAAKDGQDSEKRDEKSEGFLADPQGTNFNKPRGVTPFLHPPTPGTTQSRDHLTLSDSPVKLGVKHEAMCLWMTDASVTASK